MAISAKSFFDKYIGKVAGFAQCVGLFYAFNLEVNKGEEYSAIGACNLWFQNGQNYLWDTYDRIVGKLQFSDFIIWSGDFGAYTNDGYGHVAAYSHDSIRPGFVWCYTQNPGPTQLIELSLSGVIGALRAKNIDLGLPKPEQKLYLKKTTSVVNVRVAPDSGADIDPAYPEGIAANVDIATFGYVIGNQPYPGRTNAWVKTINGKFVWAGNLAGEIQGLPMVA